MVLWNLSINPDNKIRMVEKGALPGLVSLLRSPEERIQVPGLHPPQPTPPPPRHLFPYETDEWEGGGRGAAAPRAWLRPRTRAGEACDVRVRCCCCCWCGGGFGGFERRRRRRRPG